jgi:hypothetical protein
MTQRLSLFRPETNAFFGAFFGYLALTTDTVKVFAPRQGAISIFHIEEGLWVRAGQPLLTIAIDQITADGETVDAALLEALAHDYDRHDLGSHERQDDILVTPMTCNSPIGDMGRSIFSRRKQGLLLARVLHRRSEILFLTKGQPISMLIGRDKSTKA